MERIRAELVPRLRERSPELSETIFARVYALSEPTGNEDAEYVEGLRRAVRQGVEHSLKTLEYGDEIDDEIAFPRAIEEQARRAARSGVGLEMILRRYAAGDRMLGEFILEEAGDRFSIQTLRQLMRAQAPHVDHLMASMASAYMQELERIRSSPATRKRKAVERLLEGGQPADAEPLDYEFDGWHVGLIVGGLEATQAVRRLATALGCVPLIVPRGEGAVWAWLGGRQKIEFKTLEGLVGDGLCWSVGEARESLEGWRLTHAEAQAAHQVMLQKPRKLVRGSAVLLEAAVLRDEEVANSLSETYLQPLVDAAAGDALKETLRAYLSAGRNAATAAAALGVDRHTVQRRLRKAEEALGRLLHTCHAELEVALALDELDSGQ